MELSVDPSEVLVQELIPGGPERLFSFTPFFKHGQSVAWVMARRRRQHPMDFGHASTYVERVDIPELKHLAESFLKAVDYYGIAEVECMQDPRTGAYKLLEVNPRFWGWHSLAIGAGVDFPHLLYQDMIGEPVTPPEPLSGRSQMGALAHRHTHRGARAVGGPHVLADLPGIHARAQSLGGVVATRSATVCRRGGYDPLSVAETRFLMGKLSRASRCHEAGRVNDIGIGMGLGFLSILVLGFKWELDRPFTWGAALVVPLVSGALVGAVWSVHAWPRYAVWAAIWGLSLALALSLLLWRFFRDPERRVPTDDGVIVSPADGTVIYVKPIRESQVPLSEKQGRTFLLEDFVQADVLPRGGVLVGIAMNYLDVHVNRAPMAGRIRLLRHIKGAFGNSYAARKRS